VADENYVDLRGLFGDLQKELCVSQELVRKHAGHPGTMGDASEFNWLGILRAYLPNRYSVEKAFVVDCDGKKSEQQDLVVFDQQYTPFILKKDGMVFVPAESVYTVIEAKQSLNKGYIDYAAQKAASVRRLRRTSVAIRHAGGKYKPKEPFHIPAGIVTLSSDWKPPLGDAFREAILEHAGSDEHRIEYGCVLDGGAFRLRTDEEDEGEIVASNPDASLMSFLLTLSHTLQQLATVPAIDVLAYAKCLE
jgi:hypothetical protein